VLHTRVSEPLAEEIRQMAEELRVPVSNLVRNVLEEAFDVMEAVGENVGEWLDEALGEAERTRERIRHQRRRGRRHGRRSDSGDRAAEPPGSGAAPVGAPRAEFPEVIGWQPLIVNQPQSCADCEEPIERGERAFAGVTAAGFGGVFLCRDCMDARH
jgi:hypothetical protein